MIKSIIFHNWEIVKEEQIIFYDLSFKTGLAVCLSQIKFFFCLLKQSSLGIVPKKSFFWLNISLDFTDRGFLESRVNLLSQVPLNFFSSIFVDMFQLTFVFSSEFQLIQFKEMALSSVLTFRSHFVLEKDWKWMKEKSKKILLLFLFGPCMCLICG